MCGCGILSEFRSYLNTKCERCSGIPQERLSLLAARFGIKTLFQIGSERVFGYMGKLITQSDGRAACRKRSFPRNALCLVAGGRHLLGVRVAHDCVEPLVPGKSLFRNSESPTFSSATSLRNSENPSHSRRCSVLDVRK